MKSSKGIGKFIYEFNKETKSRKAIVVVLLMVIAGLIIGEGYALWNYSFTGNINEIATDSISLELLESNRNIIEIPNALPTTDAMGIKSEETFDFAVTSRTSSEINIPYTISLDIVDELLCSMIENPSVEVNPSCYDLMFSPEDKQTIVDFIAEFNGFEEDVAEDYYNALMDTDAAMMRQILLDAGYPEDEVDGYVTEDTEGGFLDYYIGIYEEENSVKFEMSYQFDGTNVENAVFLKDNQIKVYLTDYQGNKILGPVKVSDLDDYVIYRGVHEHSLGAKELRDMFKIRAWVDYDVDASHWTTDTNLKYIFKINVNSADESVEIISDDGIN